jgi:hypothetical protein
VEVAYLGTLKAGAFATGRGCSKNPLICNCSSSKRGKNGLMAEGPSNEQLPHAVTPNPPTPILEHAAEIAGVSAFQKAAPGLWREWQGVKAGKKLFLSLAIIALVLLNTYVRSPLKAEIADLKAEVSGLKAEISPYKAVDRLTKSLFPNTTPDARIDKILELVAQSAATDDLGVIVDDTPLAEGNVVKQGIVTIESGRTFTIKVNNKGKFPAQRVTIGLIFSDLPETEVDCPFWQKRGSTTMHDETGKITNRSIWTIIAEVDIGRKTVFAAPPVTFKDTIHGQVGIAIQVSSAKSEEKTFVGILNIPK